MPNVAIGDAAIEYGGREFILRPSFFSMQRLGSPQDIKDVTDCCYSALARHQSGAMVNHYELNACWHVITCCGGDEIPHDLFGCYDTDENGNLVFTHGAEPYGRLILLANHLLTMGIRGKPSAYMMRRARTAKQSADLFDPLEFVASAMNHLGLSTDEAWRLTMVELQRAIESKFPQDQKQKESMMSADELRALKAKIKGRKR